MLNTAYAVVFNSFMGFWRLSNSNVEVVQVHIYQMCTLLIHQQMQFFSIYFCQLVYPLQRTFLFWNPLFFLSRLKIGHRFTAQLCFCALTKLRPSFKIIFQYDGNVLSTVIQYQLDFTQFVTNYMFYIHYLTQLYFCKIACYIFVLF